MAVDLNYGVGVEGKNLVLKTLGRVYVKVKDRKYELLFRPEDLQNALNEYKDEAVNVANDNSVIIVNTESELSYLEYPGDNKLVVVKNGKLFYTSNGGYTEIQLSFNPTSLNLENLTISGQLTFTGNNIPIVLNNSNLITNLNADLLDGYHADVFPIKNNNEIINGNWTFNGTPTFVNAIGTNILSDLEEQNIKINFNSGTIYCKNIEADNLNEPEPQTYLGLVSGVGGEVWVGAELNIIDYGTISATEATGSIFEMLQEAYNNGDLPNFVTINNTEVVWDLTTFWYDKIFFDSYNLNTETYTLKNFDDPLVWNTINQNFTGSGYQLRDFQNIINALYKTDTSTFNGNYYFLKSQDMLNFRAVNCNMIVKDMYGTIGYIISVSTDALTIQLKEPNTEFLGDKLIVIGSLIQSGGIVFKATDPSISILRDVLDESSKAVYFGELSKVDPNKSGIGMILSGSIPANKVADNQLESLRNYTHTSELNIENPYIKWQQINELNEDGSGYLSKGQIRWSSNNDLVVDGSDITNSRIDNTGISDSTITKSTMTESVLKDCEIEGLDIDQSNITNSTISDSTLNTCTLDENCTFAGTWTNDNIPNLTGKTLTTCTLANDCTYEGTWTNDHIPDLSSKTLTSCSLVSCTLDKDCTYDGVWTTDNIPLLTTDKIPTLTNDHIPDLSSKTFTSCTLVSCGLDESCTFAGTWAASNIPALSNDHIPDLSDKTLTNCSLASCTLDCNSTIPDCLLNNRTYDGITLKNSTIDGSNNITGIPTQSSFDNLLNALRLRGSEVTHEPGNNLYTVDPWIHSWANCDDPILSDRDLSFIFQSSSSYSSYFPKLTTFTFSFQIPERDMSVRFYLENSSFTGRRVSNLNTADLNGDSLDSGAVVLNFGRGGQTTGNVYILYCIVDWDRRRLHVLIC